MSVQVSEKSFGSNMLYKNLDFEIQDGEKVGVIGRNGTGKSTLMQILIGQDTDFAGEVKMRRGTIMATSRQEHHGHEAKTVLEYIQGDLPEYQHLTHVIDTYPDTMGNNSRKIQEFTDALERFGDLGYYQLEDEIKQLFDSYQIDPAYMHRPLGSLSGGQKRMVELIKVQRSRGNIALIDEPTNHMDYVAKNEFIKWMNAAQEAVLVITHDRDVLHNVDRIIEIRDGRSFNFRGNYDSFLLTNKNQVTAQVNEYDLTQRRIVNLQEDIIRFRRLKEKSRTPGTIKRFKSQEQKAMAELQSLSALDKPSFWIDQESATDMTAKLSTAYEKYKAKNIKVQTRKADSDQSGRLLVKVSKLSLGYTDIPLFSDVSFSLHEGERLRLHGRNGAGKTTVVQAVIAAVNGSQPPSRRFGGDITLDKEIRIGQYEQEISPDYLPLPLNMAIERILADKNQPVSPQRVKQLLSDYLFNPAVEGEMIVERLSGGQKARIQLIAMLANDPHLLILDEPTNHLDLPSIEELENALIGYHGAVTYISHDSFFASKLGGNTVVVDV